MSEPTRYKLRPIFWDYTQTKSVSKGQIDAMGNESAYSHKDGDWVKWEDYARLKAEVERLQSIHSIDSIGIEQLKAEVERLKAENEAVKLGNKEWRQTAIERGQMNAEDAGAIGLLKAEIERLKEDKQQLEARLDFLENPRS